MRSYRGNGRLSLQKSTVDAGVIGAPGGKSALFEVELVGEVDICAAVEQIAEVQSPPSEVYRVDLKISPVKGAIGIVVIGFAAALRILCTLDCKSHPAIGPKFLTCVLLISGQRASVLVDLSPGSIAVTDSMGNDDGPLEVDPYRRLQTDGVLRMHLIDGKRNQQSDEQADCAQPRHAVSP